MHYGNQHRFLSVRNFRNSLLVLKLKKKKKREKKKQVSSIPATQITHPLLPLKINKNISKVLTFLRESSKEKTSLFISPSALYQPDNNQIHNRKRQRGGGIR